MGRSLVWSQMLSLEFFSYIKSFRSHYGPGVVSVSNKNEYQDDFQGVKAAGTLGWQTYHYRVPLSWDLWNLSSWNSLGHYRSVMGLLYLYLRVHIQLSCVPNRPCCFRSFGIQRHFVWRIEQQQWRTQEFCSGGFQQIHLWTEDKPLPLPLYFILY